MKMPSYYLKNKLAFNEVFFNIFFIKYSTGSMFFTPRLARDHGHLKRTGNLCVSSKFMGSDGPRSPSISPKELANGAENGI